ncbi:MAG TPA: 50S ribosomal protein L11 methyltransferase [Polyangiaceae bacterium]
MVVSTSKRAAPLVSEALFRAGAQGLEERADGRSRTTLVAYAEQRASLQRIWNKARRELARVLETGELPQVTFERDAVERWKTAWTEHLKPVALTKRLWLSPITSALPPLTRQQRVLVYRAALAFGDGDHPTTRLAARAIEQHYRRAPGGALLDIGAGTGVLSFVALASGAKRALGTDVDAAAVEAAAENARLNGFDRSARFVHSTVRIAGQFDLAVVNIELRPLLGVLAKLPLAARRAPELLVTGFLESQLAEVTGAVQKAGFGVRRRSREQGWVLLAASSESE